MAYRIIIIDDEKEISGGFAMFFPWKMLGYTVAGQFDNPPAEIYFMAPYSIAFCAYLNSSNALKKTSAG